MILHPTKWLPRISQTSPIHNLFMASVKIGLWWKFIAVFFIIIKDRIAFMALLAWPHIPSTEVGQSLLKFNGRLMCLFLLDLFSFPFCFPTGIHRTGTGLQETGFTCASFSTRVWDYSVRTQVHNTTQHTHSWLDSVASSSYIPQNSKINQNYLRTL